MATQIDFNLISFLQKYLAIKTVHPCRDAYQAVIDLFVKQADADGIQHTVIELGSGYQMLVLSVLGTAKELPALILNHHMDVVSAFDDGWLFPPFCGTIHDGRLYGRGVQDMKGVGVIHYAALRELKREESCLERSIYLTLVPGEENGGFDGTGQFVKSDFFKKMNVGYVLDEGVPSGITDTIVIATDERSPLQLKISVVGDSAHASRLRCLNPTYVLIDLLNNFKKLHDVSLVNVGHRDPGLYSSYHVTSLTAGCGETAINTIPARAQAVIDIRVAPGDSIDRILDFVNAQVSRYANASYEILAVAREENRSKHLSMLKKQLESVIHSEGCAVKDSVFEGASDMRFYRQLGIEAVGCSPFDDSSLLHATNECLSLESLYRGKDIIKTLLYQFCKKGCL